MKKQTKQIAPPEITIERVLWNSETGELTNLDVHNESDGCAYFLKVVGCHFHGYNKKKHENNR